MSHSFFVFVLFKCPYCTIQYLSTRGPFFNVGIKLGLTLYSQSRLLRKDTVYVVATVRAETNHLIRSITEKSMNDRRDQNVNLRSCATMPQSDISFPTDHAENAGEILGQQPTKVLFLIHFQFFWYFQLLPSHHSAGFYAKLRLLIFLFLFAVFTMEASTAVYKYLEGDAAVAAQTVSVKKNHFPSVSICPYKDSFTVSMFRQLVEGEDWKDVSFEQAFEDVPRDFEVTFSQDGKVTHTLFFNLPFFPSQYREICRTSASSINFEGSTSERLTKVTTTVRWTGDIGFCYTYSSPEMYSIGFRDSVFHLASFLWGI